MRRLVLSSFPAMILAASLLTTAIPASGQSASEIGALYNKLSWRAIGPAVMGGRTVDIEAVERTPWILYAAVGPSGVWKSENNGTTWTPVFFNETSVSVGDIAVSQSHPNIVWAGTGEATCRNSVTIGDGVYKSTDAGKTWTNMGLKDTRHISRIVINPGDPNIVYVAAMGHLWGPNEERGIYKTIDGGKTWEKVWAIDQNTGFSDLVMDPSDSLALYAAAYEHRRLPYLYTSGGPGSGIYKTTDGGKTWRRLTADLPEGLLGRIGLAVARSAPGVVYAIIEHKNGGIWRSEDKGNSWTRTCDTDTFRRVGTRPFYYSQIRVDPVNDKTIYVLATGLYVSNDMGQKFRAIGMGTHSDHHALWIDPHNPLHLVGGNDGGIDISWDAGKNWLPVQSIDAAEVYQVGFDMRNPYYVYCGLQDNGSWGGPSANLDISGITNDEWFVTGGGDGFFVKPDPSDPNTVYSNSQMNNISRMDLRIGKSKTLRPVARLDESSYRFNWNSPILLSPHDHDLVYIGGQFLFKSADRGQSWTIISPDLTTNDPKKQVDSGGSITLDNSGAEVHCTITTISESPVEPGVIWAGTDDGLLQVTRDGGKTWKNVTSGIPGLPPNTWCSRIETSRFDAGRAYAAFDGHRNDDYATYIYKTADYGKTWKLIKKNLPFGWVHVVREDPKNKNLLFAGMEFGVFASLDQGESWFPLKGYNLPTVAVHDIAVHPREHDLIIGTHGRGIWILDDISCLEDMSPEVLKSNASLFDVRPFTAFNLSNKRESFSKPAFSALNPPQGLIVTMYFKTKPKEPPKVSFINSAGETLFQLELSTQEGIQRDFWNLQFVPKTKDGKKVTASASGFFSMAVAPQGDYTVEVITGAQTLKKEARINADPRFSFPEEERLKQQDALVETILVSRRLSLMTTAALNIKRQLAGIKDDLAKTGQVPDDVSKAVKAFSDRTAVLDKELNPRELASSSMTYEELLRNGSLSQQVLFLGMSITGFPSAPTEQDIAQLQDLGKKISGLAEEMNNIIRQEIPALNKILEAHNSKTIQAPREVKD